MNNQLIVTLTVEELKAIILESVEKALEKVTQPTNDETLLKRKDVAKLFHVSLVTLNQWMKEGRVPYHRIHSRIFFKQSEVMALLANPIKIGKYGRGKIRNFEITNPAKAA